MLDVSQLCAWSISTEDLYLHAVVYRSTRALRLIRLRQRKLDHFSLRGTFDFASLPQEVFELILKEVTLTCSKYARTQPPLRYPGCVCRPDQEVWNLVETFPLFEEWCLRKVGRSLQDVKKLSNALQHKICSAFKTSSQWAGLRDQQHAASDGYCRDCKQRWYSTWETMAQIWDEMDESVEGLKAKELIANTLVECGKEIIPIYRELSKNRIPVEPDHYGVAEEDGDAVLLDWGVHNLKRVRMAIVPHNYPRPLPRSFLGNEEHMVVMEKSHKLGKVVKVSPLSNLINGSSIDLVTALHPDDGCYENNVHDQRPSGDNRERSLRIVDFTLGRDVMKIKDYMKDHFVTLGEYVAGEHVEFSEM